MGAPEKPSVMVTFFIWKLVGSEFVPQRPFGVINGKIILMKIIIMDLFFLFKGKVI